MKKLLPILALLAFFVFAGKSWAAALTLPQQLESERITTSDLARLWPDHFTDFEQILAAIFGFTLDTNITESPTSFDNSGRFTKALIRQKAAGPVGWRYLDSTSGKEVRIVVNGTNFDVDENTGTEGTPAWTNRARMPI